MIPSVLRQLVSATLTRCGPDMQASLGRQPPSNERVSDFEPEPKPEPRTSQGIHTEPELAVIPSDQGQPRPREAHKQLGNLTDLLGPDPGLGLGVGPGSAGPGSGVGSGPGSGSSVPVAAGLGPGPGDPLSGVFIPIKQVVS